MSVGAIEESVSRRQRNRKSASVLRWVLLGIALIIVLVVSLYESASHGFGGPGEPVTFEVKAGQSVSTVISSLSSDGVISSGVGFKVFDLIHGNPSPRPGWYTIERNSTFQSVHDALGAGPNTPVLDVPPGFTLREVVARLDSLVGPAYGSHVNRVLKGQEGGVRSSYEPVGASDLEGLIGSGSYLIPPGFHNHPNAAMTSNLLHVNLSKLDKWQNT